MKRLFIEITNNCNLACVFCPGTQRIPKFMDKGLFQKILREAQGLVSEIVMHVLGEPLLHPQVLDFIDITQAAGLTVMITTNGTLLNSDLAKKKIRQINISLQAMAELPNQDEYLDKVVAFAREAQAHNPEGYINLRLWNRESRQNWKSRKLEGRIYLNLDKRFAWPDIELPAIQTKGFCYGLQTHAGVLVDGTVVPCCLDAAGNIPLGNILENSLAEILLWVYSAI